ncbi:MAG: hypothetical protein NTV86_23880, partial [Planctomycetota bacterium]|nr:hypothetical protein [Planctomycetota bacterium]
MNRTILVLAAVGLWALVVPAGADTVDSWFIAGPDIWTPAIETWTSTSGGTGDGLRTIIDAGEQNLCYLCIGRDRPGILNQTGGTITNNSYWGTNIGRFTTGTYNMSGTAVFTTLGSRVPEVDLGTCDWGDLGIWTLTDQAAATVGNVGLGWWGPKGT